MTTFLMVPMRLDALYADAAQPVLEPLADFSLLPYHDAGRDVNAGTAHISENIAAEPFGDRNNALEAGVHLHWALPDALTHGIHRGGDTSLVFPAVPNRWLVVRSGGMAGKTWLVESDYLWPEGTPWAPGRITYPVTPDASHPQPYRFLGRTTVCTNGWTEDTAAKHLDNLTAFGYGDPLFHAFYPACQGVFTLHDDAVTGNAPPDGLVYDVYGWYRDPARDPFTAFRRDFPDNGLDSRKACIAAARTAFGWTWDTSLALPNRILCYARLTFSSQAKEPGLYNPSFPDALGRSIALAVGNTGTEALAAYLSHQIATPNMKRVEDQLEALSLSDALGSERLDLGARFEDARHAHTYQPVEGGTLWTIRPRKPDELAPADASKAAGKQAFVLPEELAAALDDLNALQSAFDRASAEILDLQRQIFAAWYKYIVCCYRPSDARSNYPSNDQAKWYLEGLVSLLDLLQSYTGMRRGADAFSPADLAVRYRRIPANVVPLFDTRFQAWLAGIPALQSRTSLATELTGKLDWLRSVIDALAATESTIGITGVSLVPTPAPRYWQPNEPVILLCGPGAATTDRHGEDGVLTCDVTSEDLTSADPAAIGRQATQTSSSPDFAFRQTKGNPWHPLYLEWDVSIAPVRGSISNALVHVAQVGSNILSDLRQYGPDILTWNYSLQEIRTEFIRSRNYAVTTPSTSLLTGRSIITPHAQELLAQRIEDYLIAQTVAWLRENDPESDLLEVDAGTSEGRATVLARFDSGIIDWCNQRYQIALVTGWFGAPMLTETDPSPGERTRQTLLQGVTLPDTAAKKLEYFGINQKAILDWYDEQTPGGVEAQSPIQTVVDARNALENLTMQSQALTGFNAALLMQQQTFQLPLADPINFPHYRTFTEETVRTAVGTQNRVAPMPHFDFHPLRTGRMQVNRLRLVDTFGRTTALRPETLVTTEQMTAGKGQVNLIARLTQPARLNFRWRSAHDGSIETNAHPLTTPVCGWILPDNLDGSLMIYDNGGAPLGSIDGTGRWRTPPGRPGPWFPRDIPNPYLSRMVDWLCKRAIASPATGDQPGFMDKFLDLLGTALENIEPENFEQHEALALLMGRPIALVRASVGLELMGLPAVHQDWVDYQTMLDGQPAKTDNLGAVRFPIRIGEHKQLKDGVVGYWLEDGERYAGDIFYAPQSRQAVYPEPGHDLNFYQSLDAPETLVSLLVDPRGTIHCTSGILPTKTLTLPTEHYAGALKQINITFLSTPVLTPRGQIDLPLPAEAGWGWSWVQRDGAQWTEITTTPVVAKSALLAAYPGTGMMLWDSLVAGQWLRPVAEGAKAAVAIQDRDGFNTTFTATLTDLGITAISASDVLRVLDVTARVLGPTHTDARFGPPQEIREGWLKLSRLEDDAESEEPPSTDSEEEETTP